MLCIEISINFFLNLWLFKKFKLNNSKDRFIPILYKNYSDCNNCQGIMFFSEDVMIPSKIFSKKLTSKPEHILPEFLFLFLLASKPEI